MVVIDDGHKYKLKNNGVNMGSSSSELTFFKDEDIHGTGYDGTTVQEVLRACIDRVKYIDANCPDDTIKKTDAILHHLRSALCEFEIRHIERCLAAGYPIENVKTSGDGDHFIPNKSIKSDWE